MKLAAILLLLSLPSPAPAAKIVSIGTTHRLVVSLTFDAGADRGYALQILQTLERNRVQATFGMTGLWAVHNSDLLRRMAHDGDTFINHTYDHRSFTGLSSQAPALTPSQRTWEIEQADRQIKRFTGHSARPYFRPPYGDYDAATLSLIARLGYRYSVMWTVDSGGWQRISGQSILARCLSGARPGAIILMHVGIQSQDGVVLQDVISALRRRGYRFATIPALMAMH